MLAFLHSTLALRAFDLKETRCSLCSKDKDCEQLNPIINTEPSLLRASAYKSNTTIPQLYRSLVGPYSSEDSVYNDSLKLITLCKLSSARSDFIIFIPSTNSFSIESEFLWNISPLHRSNFESGAFSWRKQSKRWKRRTKMGSWREKWMGSQLAKRFFTWESLTIFYQSVKAVYISKRNSSRACLRWRWSWRLPRLLMRIKSTSSLDSCKQLR